MIKRLHHSYCNKPKTNPQEDSTTKQSSNSQHDHTTHTTTRPTPTQHVRNAQHVGSKNQAPRGTPSTLGCVFSRFSGSWRCWTLCASVEGRLAWFWGLLAELFSGSWVTPEGFWAVLGLLWLSWRALGRLQSTLGRLLCALGELLAWKIKEMKNYALTAAGA